MPFLLALAGLVLLALAGGTPALRAEVRPDGLTLVGEASRGPFATRTEITWNSAGLHPVLSLTYTPSPPPTRTIAFSTDSLACVLVRPGQVLKVGDLLGYASASAQERIAELERRLVAVEDALVRAEVLAEIQRLRAENEVRALIPGRVLRVDVEQQGQRLHVRVVVQSP